MNKLILTMHSLIFHNLIKPKIKLQVRKYVTLLITLLIKQ